MATEKKQMQLKISSLTEDGTFLGRLSAYGNVDGRNDIVEPGAYTKTISELKGKLVMCWQHDQKEPIGVMTLADSSDGLDVKGQLNLDADVPTARRAYATMKFLQQNGLKMGLSIGYEVIKREFKDGIRHLKELRLREGSLVTIPMNDLTWVTDVKSGAVEGKDFASTLEAIQLWGAKYQLVQALEESLSQVFYVETDAAAAVAAVDTILDQFADTYKEWVRKPLLLQMWGMKGDELKAGRVLSASSRSQIEAAISNLQALLEAGTSEPEAAKHGAATVSAEPGITLHSAQQIAERLSNFTF